MSPSIVHTSVSIKAAASKLPAGEAAAKGAPSARPAPAPEGQSRRAVLRAAVGAVSAGAGLSLRAAPSVAKKAEVKVSEYEQMMARLAEQGKGPTDSDVLGKYDAVKPNCKVYKVAASSNYAEGTGLYADCKPSDVRPPKK